MTNQIIGKSMFHGYAGSFSRQPDTIIDTHPAEGAIVFGQAVVFGSNGGVVVPDDTNTADDFVGIACRETKTTIAYGPGMDTEGGKYVEYDAVPVIKRGCVNVICQNGTPTLDGDVYMRIEANSTYPDAVVGGFEAASDTTYSVKLSNVKWKGAADTNGVAELRILTTMHA